MSNDQASVINYERGYIRAFLDVRLPSEPAAQADALSRLEKIVRAVTEQFSGLMLREFESSEPKITDAGFAMTRIKFRIWPGQGALIESVVKQAVLNEMKAIDPSYPDWMVCVQSRVENDDVLGAAVASRRGRAAAPSARS